MHEDNNSGKLFGLVEQAVIPAAGLGTRLRPLTCAFPKELLPVGRLPVLAHVVAELRAAGIRRALFIVSESKPQIKSYFGSSFSNSGDSLPTLECSYVVQAEQRGLGHAISLARDWTEGQSFAVAFGDCIIESPNQPVPLARLIDLHCRRKSAATVLVEPVEPHRVSMYGIVKPAVLNDDRREIPLADIVEKPKPADAPSGLAVAARWVLESEVFDRLDSARVDARGEINLTDAVRSLITSGGQLWATVLEGNEARRDIGNFGTFFDAFIRAAMRDHEYGAVAIEAAREEIERAAILPAAARV